MSPPAKRTISAQALLLHLVAHSTSRWFGTFLFDTEQARVAANVHARMPSVWEAVNANRSTFLNPLYDDPWPDDSSDTGSSGSSAGDSDPELLDLGADDATPVDDAADVVTTLEDVATLHLVETGASSDDESDGDSTTRPPKNTQNGQAARGGVNAGDVPRPILRPSSIALPAIDCCGRPVLTAGTSIPSVARTQSMSLARGKSVRRLRMDLVDGAPGDRHHLARRLARPLSFASPTNALLSVARSPHLMPPVADLTVTAPCDGPCVGECCDSDEMDEEDVAPAPPAVASAQAGAGRAGEPPPPSQGSRVSRDARPAAVDTAEDTSGDGAGGTPSLLSGCGTPRRRTLPRHEVARLVYQPVALRPWSAVFMPWIPQVGAQCALLHLLLSAHSTGCARSRCSLNRTYARS